MNVVITSLLILVILPVSCAWIAGYYRQKQLGSVDNKEPRAQSQQLTGPGARAVAAQSNSWEALAVFSAAHIGGVHRRHRTGQHSHASDDFYSPAYRLHPGVHRRPG